MVPQTCMKCNSQNIVTVIEKSKYSMQKKMTVKCSSCQHIQTTENTCNTSKQILPNGKQYTTSEVAVRADLFASARGNPGSGIFDDMSMTLGIETPSHQTASTITR